jgi:hypothetical protein
MARAGVVCRDPGGGRKPGTQDVASLGEETILARDQQADHLALGDEDAEAAQQRHQSRHRGLHLAEVVKGGVSPEGNSRQPAVVRTLAELPRPSDWRLCAESLAVSNRVPPDVRPEGRARCVSSARRDLCGGRLATAVPTATVN